MHDPADTERDFTRIMVAIAVNDSEQPPTVLEIEQMADELLEWKYRLKQEFLRAKIAEGIAGLSRVELEMRLATRLAPACCMRQLSSPGTDLNLLSDEDLRERLVEAEVFVGRMAA